MKVIKHLGIIQIDSVNVLVRSHYMPAFSRLGAYERSLLESLAYGKRRAIFEYWAHEASLLPLEVFPLLRWRMQRARDGVGIYGALARFAREQPKLVAKVLDEIAERGPMSASDFEGAKGSGGWWGWSDTKRALEFLFWGGMLTTQARRNSFERVYDLVERVIPPEILEMPQPSPIDAQRELVLIAARAFGIATESDLRDFFRLDTRETKLRIAELVADGRLAAVAVAEWKQPAYLDPKYRLPRKIGGSALLSPFDSLVWNRPRARRLFNFDYRLEIYTPAHKRVHGYYVLPYLLDDALVARIDAKADRAAGKLIVHAVHLEAGIKSGVVMSHLKPDLEQMAQWLGLESVKLPPRLGRQ
ncbi:MAG: crosslink repair DNA glycosylase YcaQ family protein [Candidatus Baltobacteraceae bacterium]